MALSTLAGTSAMQFTGLVAARPALGFRHSIASAAPLRASGLPSFSKGSLTVTNIFSSKSETKKTTTSKPKLAVEDGIFGTSGGFGFTKQNELFVGRLAMLGFAASLIGEAITGQGIVAQLGLETGIPLYEADGFVLAFLAFNVLGAIGALGDRGRFVDAPKTGLDKAIIPAGKSFKAVIGLPEEGPTFGFTKANELFVGRLAQIGFVASIVGEILTGQGALAQLNYETGVPIQEIDFTIVVLAALLATTAITPGSGKFVEDDE